MASLVKEEGNYSKMDLLAPTVFLGMLGTQFLDFVDDQTQWITI